MLRNSENKLSIFEVQSGEQSQEGGPSLLFLLLTENHRWLPQTEARLRDQHAVSCSLTILHSSRTPCCGQSGLRVRVTPHRAATPPPTQLWLPDLPNTCKLSLLTAVSHKVSKSIEAAVTKQHGLVASKQWEFVPYSPGGWKSLRTRHQHI